MDVHLVDGTEKYIHKIFPYQEDIDMNKLQVTNVGLFSVTGVKANRFLIEKIKNVMKTDKLVITDMTANVGSDTIGFALEFLKVNAIEIEPTNFEALANNVSVYGLCEKVRTIRGDSSQILSKSVVKQDVIYFDPPWGGSDYKNSKVVDMFLGEKNIADLISENMQKAQLTIIKCPVNYNYNDLLEKIKKGNVTIFSFKKRGKIVLKFIFLHREIKRKINLKDIIYYDNISKNVSKNMSFFISDEDSQMFKSGDPYIAYSPRLKDPYAIELKNFVKNHSFFINYTKKMKLRLRTKKGENPSSKIGTKGEPKLNTKKEPVNEQKKKSPPKEEIPKKHSNSRKHVTRSPITVRRIEDLP